MLQEIKAKSVEIFKYYLSSWTPGIKANVRCPFPDHEDKNPSFSVYKSDGALKFKCFGCNRQGDAIELIKQIEGVDFKEAIEKAKSILGLQDRPTPEVIATYDYTDEDGNLLYQEVRFRPKDFRLRRPDGKGGWIYNLKDTKLVPYRLPEILKVDTVFITEGPKDADTLKDLGLSATTNAMGAGKWREHYNQYFKNKAVIILPDNDETGKKHAFQVAKSLYEVAKSIKIINLPDLPEKGDITDWISQGHSKDELLKLVDETPEWEPEETRKTAIFIRLDKVEPKPIEWLWPNYIPLGKIVLIDGNPDVGKSTIAFDLAARITTGRPMPDGQEGERGGIVILTAEDDLEDTVAPRIDSAGGDRSKIIVLKGVRTEDGSRGVNVCDLKEMKEAVKEVNAKLLIIDPLTAFLPSTVNSWHDQSVRSALTPLSEFASEAKVSILLIRHLNKRNDTTALYRGGGSIGIIGAARVAFLVGKDPEDEGLRVLACIKNNLAPMPPSLKYRIVSDGDTPVIEWLGPTDRTADSILNIATPEERSAIDEAKAFLRAILSDRPVDAKDVQKQAEDAGISKKTLQRAKKVLGIKSKKSEFSGGWVWELPTKMAKNNEDGQDGQYIKVGHLRDSWPPSQNFDAESKGEQVKLNFPIRPFRVEKRNSELNEDEIIDLGDAEIEVLE